MATTITDRRSGSSSSGPAVDRATAASGSAGFKAPANAVALANVTLSGEQTINGVTTSGTRILLTAQTDAKQNGVWVTSSGNWERAPDWDDSRDVVEGTRIWVTDDAVNGMAQWVVTTNNPIVPGTTNVTITRTAETGAPGADGDPGADGTALSINRYYWVATEGQTVFNGASATPAMSVAPSADEYSEVRLGRLALEPTSDFTRSGVNYTLVGDAAVAGEVFVVKVYSGNSLNTVSDGTVTFAKLDPTTLAVIRALETLGYGSDGQYLRTSGGALDWETVSGGGMFRGNNGTIGAASGDIFRINAQTLTVDVTIGATENAAAAGPIAVDTGVTLTVASGGTLAIV